MTPCKVYRPRRHCLGSAAGSAGYWPRLPEHFGGLRAFKDHRSEPAIVREAVRKLFGIED